MYFFIYMLLNDDITERLVSSGDRDHPGGSGGRS